MILWAIVASLAALGLYLIGDAFVTESRTRMKFFDRMERLRAAQEVEAVAFKDLQQKEAEAGEAAQKYRLAREEVQKILEE